MAQHDVFVNPNPTSRDSVPYVLDVQSPLIDQLATRLVMPLSRVGAHLSKLPVSLCPRFEVQGQALILMPHLAAPVAARLLRKPVASLKQHASSVAAALDAVVSGF